MELRFIHPMLHDEGGLLDFVLTDTPRSPSYKVTFEGDVLCENASLEEAIQTMLTHVADAAQDAIKRSET